MANWFAFFFGDDTDTVVLPSNGSVLSAPVDSSVVNISTASITIVLTGTTAGSITVEVSRDGVNDWVQSHTQPHTGGSTVINAVTALNGFASFFRITVSDTSTTAGTILAYFEGQS